jgi:PAS domain S-box-containing protein
LEYSDYVIGFEFAALDFTAPERNKYKYMLEGFDRNWVEVQGVHQATYTNLDAGKYKFRVMGSNNDNQWNEEGLSIELMVKPPLWATWWAYLAYVLVSVGVMYSFWRSHTLTVKREAEERYNRELQLYIETLEEASDCLLIADENGILKYANNAIYSMMGIIPDVARGTPMNELLFSSPRDAEEAQKGLRKNDRWHGEVFNRRGSEDYTAEVTISKVKVGLTHETAYVSIARDITARKRNEEELEHHRQKLEELVGIRTQALSREIVEHKAAQKNLASSLQEKELLLKEVHHRVKNNMQVISSLLNIQAESIDNEEFSILLSSSQQRIKSMALIHENLYQSDSLLGINFQEYIEMLGNSLCRFYTIEGVNVCMDFQVEDISLDIETAVPCGLIINELISNSLKYAYKGRTGVGTIVISFRKFEDFYILTIGDDGNGMPKDFSFDNITSMGMEIICILTNQLDGNIQLIKSKGTTFRISFPEKDEVWRKQA